MSPNVRGVSNQTQWLKTTPFMEHRKTCAGCQSPHMPCEVGSALLRRGVEEVLQDFYEPILKRGRRPQQAEEGGRAIIKGRLFRKVRP